MLILNNFYQEYSLVQSLSGFELKESTTVEESPHQLDEINAVELSPEISNETEAEFMKKFHEDIVSSAFLSIMNLLVLAEEYRTAAANFLKSLESGEGKIKGDPDICRFTAVSIQAAMEATLLEYLKNKKIKNVEAIFLTPAPCTPLRIPKDEEWKPNGTKLDEWTVEMRKRIIEELVQNNALLKVCYEDDSQRSATYNANIEKHKNIVDCPLKAKIPQELVGACYEYQDVQGRSYYIATRGFQIQQHGDVKIQKWKIWSGNNQKYFFIKP